MSVNSPLVKRNILLNPGPATTTEGVKLAQVVPDICPREKEFTNLLRHISDSLLEIAGGSGRHRCVLFGGSGTAAMDACINSIVPANTAILVINNGAYGQRMADIARAYGIECIELVSPAWEPFDVSRLEKALAENGQISCVALVHHETTTGMLNPLHEIAVVAKSHGKIVCVDAISSFAGLPLDLDSLDVDFLFASSNKCLQAMPGVAFVIAKGEALARLRDYQKRSYYLNLYSQHRFFEKTGQMQFTPPVQTLYSVKQAIEELLHESLPARYRRYRENADVLRTGLREIGFEFLLPTECWSPFLTAVYEPPEAYFSFERFHDLLYERGFTIYPGKLSEKSTFRIANIGDLNKDDMSAFLSTASAVLSLLKRDVE